MKRLLLLAIAVLLLTACADRGRIRVLTPITGRETETRRTVETLSRTEPSDGDAVMEFTVHTESLKFHADGACTHVKRMLPSNRKTLLTSAGALCAEGYTPCMTCSAGFAYLADETQADQ